MSEETKAMTPSQAFEQIRFLPATASDIDFLYALHVATMKEYVDQTWGWDEAFQEDVFLRAIEIHPDYQGQGIGTAIIHKIMAEGVLKMKPVFLPVLKVNPAKRLYERLGFSVVNETPIHFYMKTLLSK